MFLDPVPNQTQGIDTIPIINHETHHITEIETIHIIEIEVIQTIEIRITRTIDQEIIHMIDQTITDQMIIIKRDHEVLQNRNSSYNNRYRNYSQSPHRNNNRYPDSKQRYRSITPKHQRHINQVQTNDETTSDPPGRDDTGSNKLQLNHINCESSDTESDTENTISVNMITVKNDYEPIIYEHPFTSHIYENQLELLHNYYIGASGTTQTTQEVNEINTVIKPDKKDETQCSNTKHIYQNIQKEQQREKIWTIIFLLESPRNKEFQPPDLEIDFLIDSGVESNIINIPTWNEIKTLHPKLTPIETSSKLAIAQGSTLVNYGKIQLFLLPTRTIEQNKILNKPFKQILHITDIKHNIIGIPFISKYIPRINILNSKIQFYHHSYQNFTPFTINNGNT